MNVKDCMKVVYLRPPMNVKDCMKVAHQSFTNECN